jgi:2-polyprenyl-3-methyl-5-hydroxy-6-metoxy-1,4-benzoquinol methylase
MKRLDKYLQNVRIRRAASFINADSVILDIGSSNGKLFEFLGKKLKMGIGIDPALQKKIRGSNYELIKGYFPDSCPFDTRFDVITMLAVLEHIPKHKQKEVARICHDKLKPNGKIIITVPSPSVDLILRGLTMIKLIDGMSLEEHYGYDPRETETIFANDMFKLIHHSKFQFGLNNIFVFEKIA